MDVVGLMSGFDPTVLGLDAAKVLAINEISTWVKNYLDEESWDDWIAERIPLFGRFYYFIPFLVSGALALLMEPFSLGVLKSTVLYGTFATATWNFHKKVIRGE